MSILRETVRIRDEPARAHPAAAPGHPRAVPALLAHLHAQQHRAPPHRARAPPPGHAAPRAGPAAQPHELNCVLYFIKLLSTELPLLFPTRADDLYTNFTLHDRSDFIKLTSEIVFYFLSYNRGRPRRVTSL